MTIQDVERSAELLAEASSRKLGTNNLKTKLNSALETLQECRDRVLAEREVSHPKWALFINRVEKAIAQTQAAYEAVAAVIEHNEAIRKGIL